MSVRQWLWRSLWLAGLVAILLWPAIYNRGPFFFPDTRTYVRVADMAIHQITHHATEWSRLDERWGAGATSQTAAPADAVSPQQSVPTTPERKRGPNTFMYGRSIYYGLLLYVGSALGGFWSTILLQAAVIVFVAYLLLRALQWPVWPGLALIVAGLSVISDAPFFASFLMPDLFAGFVVVLCALLISARRTLSTLEYLGIYLVLAVGMLFHDSCGLIASCLVVCALLADLFSRNWKNWRGVCVVVLAIATGMIGQQIFGLGVKHVMGESPIRYPFLSARLIEDGPGTEYLRANCPGNGFLLCRYVGEYPLNSDDFLFSLQPGKSVFATASHNDRITLSKEQFRFLIATLRYKPASVIETGVRNASRQLIDIGIDDFSYPASEKSFLDHALPASLLPRFHASAAYRGAIPAGTLNVLYDVVVLLALVYLIAGCFGWLPLPAFDRTIGGLCQWTLLGLIVNAIVCGALSGVYPRYQARVAWLIPLLALLAATRALILQSSTQKTGRSVTYSVAA